LHNYGQDKKTHYYNSFTLFFAAMTARYTKDGFTYLFWRQETPATATVAGLVLAGWNCGTAIDIK
jgi:hypothetical protein